LSGRDGEVAAVAADGFAGEPEFGGDVDVGAEQRSCLFAQPVGVDAVAAGGAGDLDSGPPMWGDDLDVCLPGAAVQVPYGEAGFGGDGTEVFACVDVFALEEVGG
jgi:hypothetical protein